MNTDKLNKISVRVASMVMVFAVVGFVGVVAAQTSPSTAVENVVDVILQEVATIGSIILGLYGLVQIIQIGITDGDTSSKMKSAGLSFFLVVVLQGWSEINDWITDEDNLNVTGSVSVDPSTLDPGVVDPVVVDGMVAILASTPF